MWATAGTPVLIGFQPETVFAIDPTLCHGSNLHD